MTLGELKTVLLQNPNHRLNVIFPDGDSIEPEFHVTEVGHVTKTFIDCGGTKRRSEACVLQTWISQHDKDHRLSAGKLGNILLLAAQVVPSDELKVEIEYEGCNIVQYPLLGAEVDFTEVRLTLGKKHTDCLAKEACGIDSDSGGGSGCC